MSTKLPPLPEGFVLEDENQTIPPLPEGFVLENETQADLPMVTGGQPVTSLGRVRNPLQDVIDQNPMPAGDILDSGVVPPEQRAVQEAGLRQFGHGLALNHGEYLGAVKDKLLQKAGLQPKMGWDEMLEQKRSDIAKDRELAGMGPNFAGNMVTGLATAAIPGASTYTGMALAGGLAGGGHGDDTGDFWGSAAVGAITGPVFKAFPGAAKFVLKAGTNLRNIASRFSARTVDQLNTLGFKTPEKFMEFGRKMLKLGITGGDDKTVMAMYETAKATKGQVGKAIGNIYDQADEVMAAQNKGITPADLISGVYGRIAGGRFPSNPEITSVLKVVAQRLEKTQHAGQKLTIKHVRELIKTLEDTIEPMAIQVDGQLNPTRIATLQLRDVLYDTMDDLLPNKTPEFMQMRALYRELTHATDALSAQAVTFGGRMFSGGGLLQAADKSAGLRNTLQGGLGIVEAITSPTRFIELIPDQFQKHFADAVWAGGHAMKVRYDLMMQANQSFRDAMTQKENPFEKELKILREQEGEDE